MVNIKSATCYPPSNISSVLCSYLSDLKTKEWMKAESDCNKVLSWEPQNIKGIQPTL